MGNDWKEKLKKFSIKEHTKDQNQPKGYPNEGFDKNSPDRKISASTLTTPKPIMGIPVVSTPISKKSISPLPNLPILTGEKITVGLDWGTSFTKVCMRRELGGEDVPIYPISLETKIPNNIQSLLCPSIVGLENGNVYFGHKAANIAGGGRIYRHLKVCLVCKLEKSASECVSTEICPFRDDKEISNLVTLFLAWAMKSAREYLPNEIQKTPPSFIYNLGVPIKYLDWNNNPLILNKYKKIAYDAHILSEGLMQGIKLSKALGWLDQIKNESVPEIEKSNILLAPESSAAIVSFVKSENSRSGLYGIVDIGAWTTDISFFRLSDWDIETRGVPLLSFYAAEVSRNAIKSIDDKLVKCLMDLAGIESIKGFEDGDLCSKMGICREKGNLVGKEIRFNTLAGNLDKITIESYVLEFSKGVISERFKRNFGATLKMASKKENVPDNWNNFTLFFTGGGCNEICFQKKINNNFIKLSPIIRNDMLSFPMLQTNNGKQGPERLAVAAGLSYPLGMWPEQLVPSEIPIWTPTPLRQIPEADDEPG